MFPRIRNYFDKQKNWFKFFAQSILFFGIGLFLIKVSYIHEFDAKNIDYWMETKNDGYCIYRYLNTETNEIHFCEKSYSKEMILLGYKCPESETFYWSLITDTKNCEFTSDLGTYFVLMFVAVISIGIGLIELLAVFAVMFENNELLGWIPSNSPVVRQQENYEIV